MKIEKSNKKAFTIVELISVILILTAVLLIAIPSLFFLLKNSKNNLYEEQMDLIKKSSHLFALENPSVINQLNGNRNDYKTLYLGPDIQDKGYIDYNTNNPITNKPFSRDLEIYVTVDDKDTPIYEYYDPESDLKLNVTEKETTPIGSTFDLLKNVSSSYGDTDLTSKINIYNNEVKITSIDTSKQGIYLIKYEIEYNGLKQVKYRKVYVGEDNTPILTLYGNNPLYHEVNTDFIVPMDIGAKRKNGEVIETTKITYTNNVNPNVLGTYTIVYKVVDEAYNTSTTLTRTVIVRDTTPPLIVSIVGNAKIINQNQTLDLKSLVTVTDNYDTGIVSKLQITQSPTLNTAKSGEYIISYNVTDSSNNKASAVKIKVVVRDSTKPTIVLNGGNTAIDVTGKYIEPGFTATDNSDTNISNNVSIKYYDSNGKEVTKDYMENMSGVYTIKYDLTDSSGNKADTKTRTLTVRPLITPPATVFVEVNTPTFTLPTATVKYSSVGEKQISGVSNVNTKAIGSYTITYNYSYPEGSSAAVSATPKTTTVVVRDTTKPIIASKVGTIYEINQNGTVDLTSLVTVTDNYDTNILSKLTTSSSPVLDTSKAGDYVITYNVTDSSGNKADPLKITIRVKDNSAPIITLTGGTVIFNVTTSYIEPGYSAIDNIDGNVTSKVIVKYYNSNNTEVTKAAMEGLAGVYTAKYTVTDNGGNTATASRTINVRPVITATATIYHEAGTTFTTPSATARYSTSGTTTVTGQNEGVNTNKYGGTFKVRYDYSYGGVSATTVYTNVNVVDSQKPSIVLTGGAIIFDIGTTYSEPGYSASDLGDGSLTSKVTVKYYNSSNVEVTKAAMEGLSGVYTVKYNVVDSAGNAATEVTRTVTVRPVITPPATVYHEINTGFGAPNATVKYSSSATTTVSPSSNVNIYALGTYTLTYNYTYNGASATTKTTSVIVRDTIAPTYTGYEIKNVSSTGFDVYMYGVSDAGSGVNRVQFPTWTESGGQDDIIWYSANNLGGGTWQYRVSTSSHGGQTGNYLVHMYAYDNAGNYSVATTNVVLPSLTLVDAIDMGLIKQFDYIDYVPDYKTLGSYKTDQTIGWRLWQKTAQMSGSNISSAQIYMISDKADSNYSSMYMAKSNCGYPLANDRLYLDGNGCYSEIDTYNVFDIYKSSALTRQFDLNGRTHFVGTSAAPLTIYDFYGSDAGVYQNGWTYVDKFSTVIPNRDSLVCTIRNSSQMPGGVLKISEYWFAYNPYDYSWGDLNCPKSSLDLTSIQSGSTIGSILLPKNSNTFHVLDDPAAYNRIGTYNHPLYPHVSSQVQFLTDRMGGCQFQLYRYKYTATVNNISMTKKVYYMETMTDNVDSCNANHRWGSEQWNYYRYYTGSAALRPVVTLSDTYRSDNTYTILVDTSTPGRDGSSKEKAWKIMLRP